MEGFDERVQLLLKSRYPNVVVRKQKLTVYDEGFTENMRKK
jgi:hypothetical protein